MKEKTKKSDFISIFTNAGSSGSSRMCSRLLPNLLILSLLAGASTRVMGQMAEHRASYDIDVSLDTINKTLTGRTVLHWKNPSTDTVHELQFHLYLNAFRNTESVWLSEDRMILSMAGSKWFEECGWGWVTVDAMSDAAGHPLQAGFEFLPPAEYPGDRTVLRVPLQDAVLPGDTAMFTYVWSAKIPKTMIRTGYNREFYHLAQWFPKLGVYEPAGMRFAREGGWNCHPYHANSEYYADFGVYNVNITVPLGFVVGASGILQNQEAHGEMAIWRFRAEDVIDFTWSASPHFKQLEETWQEVRIDLLVYPEHERFAHRFFEPVKFGLEYLQEHVGVYPYPELTIVAVPLHGIFTGPMEYPTLITGLTSPLLPHGMKFTETLIVHELIHQYFMQMVATNEQEEPWMDEGITTYYETRIMDAYFGAGQSVLDFDQWQVGSLEYSRYTYLSAGVSRKYPGNLKSWEYSPPAYNVVSYDKTALWMRTLDGLLGREVMDEVMRTYFEQWRFRHPCAEDFVTVVNEVVQRRLPDHWPGGMDWFFVQVLDGAGTCDYQVSSVQNEKVDAPAGFLTDDAVCVVPQGKGPEVQARVIVSREGDLHFPVQIRVEFTDGTEINKIWDGVDAVKEYTFSGLSEVMCVEIDPERKIVLDENYLNNSFCVEVDHIAINAYSARWLVTIQRCLEALSLLM